MKTYFEIITPEKARYYLGKNKRNRPAINTLVAEYSRLMENNKWHEQTGEPIIFNENGDLIDGQHRLKAIVDSKKALEFLIVEQASNEAINYIDQGRKRTAGDVFAINRIPSSTNVSAAIARYSLMKNNFYGHANRSSRLTPKELYEIYIKNSEYYNRIIRIANNLYQKDTFNVLSVSDIAAYIMFFNDFSEEISYYFIHTLYEQKPALQLLRDLLIKNKTNLKKLTTRSKTHLVILAWNNFVKGKIPKRYNLTTESIIIESPKISIDDLKDIFND